MNLPPSSSLSPPPIPSLASVKGDDVQKQKMKKNAVVRSSAVDAKEAKVPLTLRMGEGVEGGVKSGEKNPFYRRERNRARGVIRERK